LSENTHRNGILHTAVARPGDPAQSAAEDLARRLLDDLDYVGTMALELFETTDGLVANEMAPRVHNSGHWTIEGAETSQFENHLRAICGLPLGATAPVGYAAMVNIVGDWPDTAPILSLAGAHLHDYAKGPRPGRKIGHVTVRADSARERDARVEQVSALI
jgi:5-(carboxyamino)imidazole ribonucleotide synthase